MSKASTAILHLFREQSGFVSGEMISRELNVSRTAIWKHINTLRKAGYVIEAIPSRGYHMISAPDVLSAEAITAQMKTVVIGKRFICHAETASTNSDAFHLAEQGAGEGTVVLADSQNSGKGRLGRVWSSPRGVNLYASIILRPLVMPCEAAQLTFLSAVAVARSIELITGLKPEIKWPNDILINGRKIAGLLNEMSSETDRVNFVILGIGVNLNMNSEQFPSDLRQPATSLLLELGKPVQRAQFAAVMLGELDKQYAEFQLKGFASVRDEWQQRCNASGRKIEVSDNGFATRLGMFAGIDADGALLMRHDNGSVARIISGDVRVV